MKSMKSLLKDKNGAGHIDTGVKIIIAVVIGALVLGGLYALFTGVVLPNLNTEVDGMMDYGENGVTVQRVLDDQSGTYVLQYSYDGKHWQSVQMPSYGSGSSVYSLISHEDQSAALVKNGSTYHLIVSTDGINWTQRFSFTAQSITHFYYGTSSQLPNTAGSFSGERFVLRYQSSGSMYYTSSASNVATWSNAGWSDLIPLY